MPKLVDTRGDLVSDAKLSLDMPRVLAASAAEKNNSQASQEIDPRLSNTTQLVIGGDGSVSDIESYLPQLTLIAIEFPSFMDGRGFSLAQKLCTHPNFKGELRACGNFMLDQLHYLKRCGFSSFELGDDADLETARTTLNAFSEHYQAACDESQPLYRRRAS